MTERTPPEPGETLGSLSSLVNHPPRETLRADPAERTNVARAVSTPPPARSELPPLRLGARDDHEATDLSIVRTLGEGGMGRVYLATQPSLRRDVAVKTCSDGDEGGADALVQEGVLTGMLEHPNIPPIHALGRDTAGRPLLVMKRIEGVSWAEILADPGHPFRADHPLFARDALVAHLEILIQLCNALQFAHERGVIHRDIKPENVMLGRHGEVYLIDWGIAYHRAWHHDEGARLVGTPAYLAPEMAGGGTPDARTDVYLLGATLHEILSGRPPHDAATASEALRLAVTSPPRTFGVDVPTELASLCDRALSRDPSARPASAAELQSALRDYLSHRGASALTDAASSRLGELRAALASGADETTCARLAIECRFGFHQALREWPDHRAARDGLRDVLTLLADQELAREDHEGAAALLAEMPDENPELRARLDELRQRIAREEAQAREMDLRVAWRERTVLSLMGVLLGGGLVWLRWRTPPPSLFGYDAHLTMVRVSIGLLLIGVVVLAAVRKRMMQNAFNRRWTTLLLVGGAMVLVHRVLALRLLPGAPMTALSDLLLASITLATTAIYVTPRLAWSSLVFAAGAGVIALFPAHTPSIANWTLVVGSTAGAFAMRAAARDEQSVRRRRT